MVGTQKREGGGPCSAPARGSSRQGQSVALRPEDICHRRQLPLPLRAGQGGTGWASEGGGEAAVWLAQLRQEGAAWGACGVLGWASPQPGQPDPSSLPGPEPLHCREVPGPPCASVCTCHTDRQAGSREEQVKWHRAPVRRPSPSQTPRG